MGFFLNIQWNTKEKNSSNIFLKIELVNELLEKYI